MKLGRLVGSGNISDGIDFGKFSFTRPRVIVLELAKIHQNWLVGALEATIFFIMKLGMCLCHHKISVPFENQLSDFYGW